MQIYFFLNVRVLKLTIAHHAGGYGLTGVSWIKLLNDLFPSRVPVNMVENIARRSRIMGTTMMMITIITLILKREGEREKEGRLDFLVNCLINDSSFSFHP